MNGMALHGGVVPYGGTFMCFTDYARPSMRLSALMGAKVVYVMTHDSIGLGEDGPTHQPVEHLAMLRATPGMRVIRPADTVETAEAWEIALTSQGPTVLALSRQNLKPVRTEHTNKNLSAQGAYVLAEATGKRQVILIATGSEVEIAMAARERLEAQGVGTRVVSMPSMEPWDRWLLGQGGREGKAGFVGMSTFGASAPAEVLYEKFGITAENVAQTALGLL
jgi:transketolase